MKKYISIPKVLSLSVVLVAILFSNFILSSPQIFAQTSPSENSGNTLRSRQYIELISSIFNFVEENYVDQVNPELLYEGALKGMLESLDDPYTSYLDKVSMRNLNDTTLGNFGGVGLTITKPNTSTAEKPAYVEVSSPIDGGPGFKAGIQAGDFLVEINGIETKNITMEEVLSMLRGTIGESVDVVVKRGKNMQFSVRIIRELIEVPTVKYGLLETKKKTLGYLKIIEFTPATKQRVQEAIGFFKENSYEGLIIDLRNNPGGLIDSVYQVADVFIDYGAIVSTRGGPTFNDTTFFADAEKTLVNNMPIVVLINRGSASASEILAGALKDHHLAYLVGERTYGKGSVQQVIPLYNKDGIKLTIARYYTPSDVNIDKVGIPPDFEVLFPELSEKEEEAYVKLIESNVIEKYVSDHQKMNEQDIALYAKQLVNNYPLNEMSLRKLIRNEVYRTRGALLFDLDYDIQLLAAMEIFDTESFNARMKNAKTLKELQEALVLAENGE